MSEPVYVTRSVLPPLTDFLPYVADIFASHQLTNQGKYVTKLEQDLAAYLQAQSLLAVANGTLALQLALKYLNLHGKKVLTTPFTYVATVSALLWEQCEPVFADIDPQTCCLDPVQAAAKLDSQPDIAGILPVHVFGNAVAVKEVEELAKKRNIPVLYDAAHAFGCRLNGRSIFTYGDLTIGSFHSTKLFHTVEGGCIAAQNKDARQELELLRAFGHRGDTHVLPGINAKMSELHAAMGLCLLPGIETIIAKRKAATDRYNSALEPEKTEGLRTIKLADGLEWNHAYFPVIFESEKSLKAVSDALAQEKIYPRRYFYPSLTKLPYLKPQTAPVAESIATRILCLPLWPDMEVSLIDKICTIIKQKLR